MIGLSANRKVWLRAASLAFFRLTDRLCLGFLFYKLFAVGGLVGRYNFFG